MQVSGLNQPVMGAGIGFAAMSRHKIDAAWKRVLGQGCQSGPKELDQAFGQVAASERRDFLKWFLQNAGINVKEPTDPVQSVRAWKALARKIPVELRAVDAQLPAQFGDRRITVGKLPEIRPQHATQLGGRASVYGMSHSGLQRFGKHDRSGQKGRLPVKKS